MYLIILHHNTACKKEDEKLISTKTVRKDFEAHIDKRKSKFFFLFMNNLMLLNLNRQSFGVIVTKSVQISIDVSLVHKL